MVTEKTVSLNNDDIIKEFKLPFKAQEVRVED